MRRRPQVVRVMMRESISPGIQAFYQCSGRRLMPPNTANLRRRPLAHGAVEMNGSGPFFRGLGIIGFLPQVSQVPLLDANINLLRLPGRLCLTELAGGDAQCRMTKPECRINDECPNDEGQSTQGRRTTGREQDEQGTDR